MNQICVNHVKYINYIYSNKKNSIYLIKHF